jgi:hypothetical protein
MLKFQYYTFLPGTLTDLSDVPVKPAACTYVFYGTMKNGMRVSKKGMTGG